MMIIPTHPAAVGLRRATWGSSAIIPVIISVIISTVAPMIVSFAIVVLVHTTRWIRNRGRGVDRRCGWVRRDIRGICDRERGVDGRCARELKEIAHWGSCGS